jgi:Zn-dependent protease
MTSNYQDTYDADYRALEEKQVEKPKSPPGKWRKFLGPVATMLLFAATKLKFIVTILKSIKFLSTGITALLSIGAYAVWFGWQFGVGIVVLIFIHEMGHVIVLRRYGVKASAPVFIPFLGAFIAMKQLPKDAVMEAVVGLGGPVIGSLGALAAWILYQTYDNPIFLAMTYLGVLLNLFNLLPVMPLDGGRAVGAISRWLWVLGYAALIGLMFLRPSPIVFIILLIGAPEVWNAIRNRKGADDYYVVPMSKRLAVGAAYFGLIAVLGAALYELEPLLVANRPG